MGAPLSLLRWQELVPAQQAQVLGLQIAAQQLEYAGSIERAVAACEAAGPDEVAGLVVLSGGEPVGFVVLSRAGRRPDWAPAGMVALTAMRIDQRMQGRGLGRATLHALEAWVCNHWPGSRGIALCVDEGNTEGRRAYEAVGYAAFTPPRAGRIGPVHYLCKALRGPQLQSPMQPQPQPQPQLQTQDGAGPPAASPSLAEPISKEQTAMKITVETTVHAPIDRVWRAYTTPEDIVQWNAASADWHTTRASVDLRAGGHFSSRMEAKDGSFGFDFEGTYTAVQPQRLIEYSFGDRVARVDFAEGPDGVRVQVAFDAESSHSPEQQQQGWQAILDNFRRHVEATPQA